MRRARLRVPAGLSRPGRCLQRQAVTVVWDERPKSGPYSIHLRPAIPAVLSTRGNRRPGPVGTLASHTTAPSRIGMPGLGIPSPLGRDAIIHRGTVGPDQVLALGEPCGLIRLDPDVE